MTKVFPESSASKLVRTPDKVGNFRIEREIGRGGMGVVYLAEDMALHRQVAIKTLPQELGLNPIALARFEREARILASLNHPHIASIHQFVEHEGLSYLILEYVPGESLAKSMRRGPIDPGKAFRLALPIAAGLAAAHDKGVVHRDLKPDNICVTPEGFVKILDFGLATTAASEDADAANRMKPSGQSQVMGTPAYMSPEQGRGEPVDQRTDVWAFGCVLYAMLSGRLPFAGHSFAELLEAILTSEPDWTVLPVDIPEDVVGLIRGCLEKDPLRRQRDLRGAREILLRALRGDYDWQSDADAIPAPRHNLPWQFSKLIGRENELADLKQLIQGSQLVTLTGSGGCGKTRLAIEIAHQLVGEFSGGVWLVELAPLSDPRIVPSMLAKALGVQERANEQVVTTLINSLKAKRLLIILDNCEHLLSSIADLCSSLLQHCQSARILATSREALHLDGEASYPVSPLVAPDPATIGDACTLLDYSAAQLFADRAVQYRRDFTVTDDNAHAVAEVCWQLDGIPLALELAAARLRLLNVERIAEKLSNRFRLLKAGNPRALPRHQTLGALIDWSYNLLDGREKQLLQRVSVFRGGFTLHAAAAVCGDQQQDEFELLHVLSALAEKSLIVVDRANDETRYHLLETIRQYAEDRLLEAGAAKRIRDQHLNYFVEFVKTVTSRGIPDEVRVLNQFDVEHNNLRAALDWSIAEDRLAEQAIGLVAVLGRFWELRGHWTEGRARLTHAVQKSQPKSCELAAALRLIGNIANQQGDFTAARTYYDKSLTMAREMADLPSVAATLNNSAYVPLEQGQYDQARSRYEEALNLAKRLGHQRMLAFATLGLAEVAFAEGDYAEMQRHCEESLRVSRVISNEKCAVDSLTLLGYAAVDRHDYQKAHFLFEEGLALCSRLDYQPGMARLLMGLGDLLLTRGQTQAALAKFQETLRIHRDIGYKQRIALSLEAIAECFAELAKPNEACKLLGAAQALTEQIGASLPRRRASRLEKTIARLQDVLGRSQFQQLWTAGRTLPLETFDYLFGER